MLKRNRLEAPYGNVDHIDEIGAKLGVNNDFDREIASFEERNRLMRERTAKELDRHSQARIERTMALFSDSSNLSANKGSTDSSAIDDIDDENEISHGRSR